MLRLHQAKNSAGAEKEKIIVLQKISTPLQDARHGDRDRSRLPPKSLDQQIREKYKKVPRKFTNCSLAPPAQTTVLQTLYLEDSCSMFIGNSFNHSKVVFLRIVFYSFIMNRCISQVFIRDILTLSAKSGRQMVVDITSKTASETLTKMLATQDRRSTKRTRRQRTNVTHFCFSWQRTSHFKKSLSPFDPPIPDYVLTFLLFMLFSKMNNCSICNFR